MTKQKLYFKKELNIAALNTKKLGKVRKILFFTPVFFIFPNCLTNCKSFN